MFSKIGNNVLFNLNLMECIRKIRTFGSIFKIRNNYVKILQTPHIPTWGSW